MVVCSLGYRVCHGQSTATHVNQIDSVFASYSPRWIHEDDNGQLHRNKSINNFQNGLIVQRNRLACLSVIDGMLGDPYPLYISFRTSLLRTSGEGPSLLASSVTNAPNNINGCLRERRR